MPRINITKSFVASTAIILSMCAGQAQAAKSKENLDKLMGLSLDSLFNQTVSVASKRPEKLSEAPGVISLITSEEIERFGYQNLYDVLERIPNTYGHFTPTFPENTISIRGLDTPDVNHHTLILLNGRPVRDAISGGFSSPMFKMFPVHMIDHIEVIRGPGSVLYGTNAFAGVINVVTKEREEEGQSAEFNAYYGSYNSASSGMSGSMKKGDFTAQASFLRRAANGYTYDYTDAAGRNDGPKTNGDGHSLFFDMQYGKWSAHGFSGYTDDLYLNQSFFYPTGEIRTRRNFLDVGYEHDFRDTSWKLMNNLTYNSANLYGAVPLPMRSDSFLVESTLTGEVIDGLNLVMGGTYDHLNGSLKDAGGKSDATRWSVYGQLDYRLVDWIKLIGGLQFNKVNGKHSDLSPRVGTIVNFTDHMGIKLLHSEAFRSPAFGDTNLNFPAQIGDPDLQPETVTTTDLQFFYEEEEFSVSATAYKSKIEDIVIQDFLGVPGASILQIQNGGTHDFEGIEFEGKYYLDDEWMAVGSVSYQTGDNNAGNNNDAGIIPNFMAKLGLSYAGLDNGLTLGVYDQYAGAPDNIVDTAPPTMQAVNPEGDSHHLVSLNAGVNVNTYFDVVDLPEIDFNLYVENMLDEQVYYPNFVSQTTNTYLLNGGRTVYGKVKISF